MKTICLVVWMSLLFSLGPWEAVWGATSDVAPSIQEQPKGASVIESMDVTFQVSARGTPPLSFQWRKDGKNLPGTQSEELKLTDVDVKDSGRYSVVFTNAVGSVTSSEATLIVGSPYALLPVAGPWDGFPPGSADGPGPDARLNGAEGVTLDSNGNVLVADFGNHTIRKITPVGTNWTVTTLAGLAGISGTNNGPVGAARFRHPKDVAVDRGGNVIVADWGNDWVRKITSSGELSVLRESVRAGEGLPPISGWIAPARQTPLIVPFQVTNVVGTYLPGTGGGSGSGGNSGGGTTTPPPAGSIACTIATLAGSDDLYAHKDEKGVISGASTESTSSEPPTFH